MRILVTGGSGFVGQALLARLASMNQFEVLAVSRVARELSVAPIRWVSVGELGGATDWSSALAKGNVVIHAAGRAHVTKEHSRSNPLAEYRRVNVDGALNLARQAAAAAVKRFIFISSVKVNGERTKADKAFSANDTPAPVDSYGISKWEAELGLADIARDTGLEVVIVRPPLVYGPGVKANFLAMMRAVHRGIPLPLGAIHNLRSFVALDNLIDMLVTCIEHPAAANQTFLVSDGEDISTTDLLRRLGDALGKPARLIPVSERVLRLGAAILGGRAVAQRLCGSLCVDISKTRQLLSWTPPVSVDEGLHRTAEEFLREARV